MGEMMDIKSRYPKVTKLLEKHAARYKAEADSLRRELEVARQLRSACLDVLAQVENERDEARKEADKAKNEARYWEATYLQIAEHTRKANDEIADLKVKLENVCHNNRNAGKYAEIRFEKLKTAYESLSEKVHEVWLSVPDVNHVMEEED